jgi:hypothetical protein
MVDLRSVGFGIGMERLRLSPKAKNATAATDQALAELEEKLNAHERGKESKKTHLNPRSDLQ